MVSGKCFYFLFSHQHTFLYWLNDPFKAEDRIESALRDVCLFKHISQYGYLHRTLSGQSLTAGSAGGSPEEVVGVGPNGPDESLGQQW